MDNEIFTITIRFCTGRVVDFEFKKKSLGSEVLSRCREYFKVGAITNFGLELPSGFWLSPDKTLDRQLRRESSQNHGEELTATFRVRFWPRHPESDGNIELQRLLYLQFKDDIITKRLFIPNSETKTILVQLGAFQQQIDYGDTPGKEIIIRDRSLMDKMKHYHRKYRGMHRGEAISKFLAKGTQLLHYGVETYKAEMDHNMYILGVHCHGYYLYTAAQFESEQPGQLIKWSKIKEFRYRDKNFFIKFKKLVDLPQQTFHLSSYARARALFSSLMDYHMYYRPKTEEDKKKSPSLAISSQIKRLAIGTKATSLLKTPTGSEEYLLDKKDISGPFKSTPSAEGAPANGSNGRLTPYRRTLKEKMDPFKPAGTVVIDGPIRPDKIRAPRMGVSHPSTSPDIVTSATWDIDPFTPTTTCAKSSFPNNVGKNRWEYTLCPTARGDFGFQFYGGIDQGLNPTITRAEDGLLTGDILLSVNGVPVKEHTYNQIKESIQSSVAMCRLNLVVYRDSKSFEDSVKAIEEGIVSGSLVRQFEQIPNVRPDLSRATSLRRGNEAKNRYRDVLPYDDTRVKLSNNRYINASWIDIHASNFHRQWVAAQGPLENTICDFWRCVWETDVTAIVMLCKLVESMQDKCARYWPSELHMPEDYETHDVSMESEEHGEFAIKRTFILTELKSGKSRQIQHWQYTEWPDHGVPENPDHFLNFFHTVRLELPVPDPILVHCSAGVGRTGVTIALDAAVAAIEQKISINPLNTVQEIRNQRCMMIQNSSQFEMLLKLISYVAHRQNQTS